MKSCFYLNIFLTNVFSLSQLKKEHKVFFFVLLQKMYNTVALGLTNVRHSNVCRKDILGGGGVVSDSEKPIIETNYIFTTINVYRKI